MKTCYYEACDAPHLLCGYIQRIRFEAAKWGLFPLPFVGLSAHISSVDQHMQGSDQPVGMVSCNTKSYADVTYSMDIRFSASE